MTVSEEAQQSLRTLPDPALVPAFPDVGRQWRLWAAMLGGDVAAYLAQAVGAGREDRLSATPLPRGFDPIRVMAARTLMK